MKKIGSVLPFIPKPKKGLSALSNRERQIVNLSGALAEQTREEANELGFMSRLLIMVNLPYRDPGEECKNWWRQNGKISINVTSGYKGDESIGLPYGTYPRLILAYLATQAVKTQSPKIFLGKSFGTFLRALDIKYGVKQYKQLQMQLKRTLGASFAWTYETEKNWSRLNVQVSHYCELWWDTKVPEQGSLWESYIELNHHFFHEITRNAVPLDLRVLSVLKNSPLGLDLYMFISWRVFKINKPVFISWESLQRQLGGQFLNIHEFSRKCRTHIKRIQAICPYLNIQVIKGRLCLKPSFY